MARRRGRSPAHLIPVKPYSALAEVYDDVMRHVDYETWVEYIVSILHRCGASAERVLELGCGTGSFARIFTDLIDVSEYVATDGSPEMLDIAREKLTAENIVLRLLDFGSFEVNRPFDVVLLLYDGLNYLLEADAVNAFLNCCHRALAPDGVLVFDQSTPANSENNQGYFDYDGETGAQRYERTSRYDAVTRLHTTDFTIESAGCHNWERHTQRAYTLEEIRRLVEAASFDILAVYDDFSFRPGCATSERLHWVLTTGRTA